MSDLNVKEYDMKAKKAQNAHIDIDNRQKSIKLTVSHRAIIRKAVKAVLEYEDFPFDAEVSVSVVTVPEIHALNKIYRDKDRPTDVLSFPQHEDGEWENGHGVVTLGDVVLCADILSAQSVSFGHTFERELAYLTIHSVLHLLGYEHEDGGEEERIMTEKQNELIKILGL